MQPVVRPVQSETPTGLDDILQTVQLPRADGRVGLWPAEPPKSSGATAKITALQPSPGRFGGGNGGRITDYHHSVWTNPSRPSSSLGKGWIGLDWTIRLIVDGSPDGLPAALVVNKVVRSPSCPVSARNRTGREEIVRLAWQAGMTRPD